MVRGDRAHASTAGTVLRRRPGGGGPLASPAWPHVPSKECIRPMGQSSARPENLKAFQTSTGPLDTSIESSHTSLSSALSSFNANNEWGSIDATGLVANVASFAKL